MKNNFHSLRHPILALALTFFLAGCGDDDSSGSVTSPEEDSSSSVSKDYDVSSSSQAKSSSSSSIASQSNDGKTSVSSNQKDADTSSSAKSNSSSSTASQSNDGETSVSSSSNQKDADTSSSAKSSSSSSIAPQSNGGETSASSSSNQNDADTSSTTESSSSSTVEEKSSSSESQELDIQVSGTCMADYPTQANLRIKVTKAYMQTVSSERHSGSLWYVVDNCQRLGGTLSKTISGDTLYLEYVDAEAFSYCLCWSDYTVSYGPEFEDLKYIDFYAPYGGHSVYEIIYEPDPGKPTMPGSSSSSLNSVSSTKSSSSIALSSSGY